MEKENEKKRKKRTCNKIYNSHIVIGLPYTHTQKKIKKNKIK